MTEATPSSYWIASNALYITLNANGDPDYIVGNTAAGAQILCYMKDIPGLDYDAGHNYRRWPLSLSSTYFYSADRIYVYAAIPRPGNPYDTAVVVFPSEHIDIYGKNEDGQQIGDDQYYYIFLQGIITATNAGRTLNRDWEDGHRIQTGTLSSDEAIDAGGNQTWWRYSSVDDAVTFLKNIFMDPESVFKNLNFGSGVLTDVATNSEDDEDDDKVVTPAYLGEYGKTHFLSKIIDDVAAGLITFMKGLEAGDYFRSITGTAQDTGAKIFPDGTGDFINLVFSQILKSKGARSGFLDGTGILMDAAKGKIEADGMEVRGFLKVMELIINRLQLMESDYSFTEGDTTERIDFSDNGQRMVLTMHKEHDNDHTPFYPGDILYAKVNDLLDHGTYYTCWVRVISVDLATNTIKVAPYPALKQSGDIYVPGGTNFTFLGTEIDGNDFTAALLQDYTAYPDGYEKILNLTRHGNVADGLENGDDPASYSDQVKQSQLGRQQSWVLSTTDKRLSFFWNVDEPIVRDENYALCLGILPDLANLPTTRNRNMPSLYVNTVFADHYDRANYPAKVVKEDRGAWQSAPTAIYSGRYGGTYTPDGTLDPSDPELRDYLPYVTAIPGYAGTYQPGDEISEPYHYRTFTKNAWLSHRLDTGHYRSLSDKQLMLKMLEEWRETVDLEISRVWTNGVLWECLVDGTTQEPTLGCTDWLIISGGTFSLGFYTDGEDPTPIMGLAVRPGNIDETVVPYLIWGQEDISNMVTAWRWERESQYEALDEAWANSAHTDPADPTSPLKSRTRTLHLTTDDLPAGWDADDGKVGFKCTAYFLMDGEEAEIINRISIV